ncbi:hypothetical protein DSCO28_71150 [Desulfosarcina ovata subsp. sediminis]|uniref:PEP-CTERM protein-sorting domain-containing protein n=1 Tax=Desulfosarcina ovata subsp. sediminis TaxID=885957 RepID=A0A5K8A1W3_9BACT|nr:PEP-CTERM sorting domain-containing protein [Desulfosarcina ovata]BBO86549.1 hypothetical protein DSCO28_71150 [Desulfosarcina ovata subsp. sediminis]
MKKKLTLLLALVLSICFYGIGYTATITYEFTGLDSSNGTLSSPYVMEVDGMTVEITATVDSASGTLHQNTENGMGVSGENGNNRVGNGEALIFDFGSSLVTLFSTELTFHADFTEGSSFDLYADSTFVDSFTFESNSGLTIDFSSYDIQASVFEFLGTETSEDADSGFRIRELTVDYESSAVPVPGAIWLLGSGLIGLLGVKRRKLSCKKEN